MWPGAGNLWAITALITALSLWIKHLKLLFFWANSFLCFCVRALVLTGYTNKNIHICPINCCSRTQTTASKGRDWKRQQRTSRNAPNSWFLCLDCDTPVIYTHAVVRKNKLLELSTFLHKFNIKYQSASTESMQMLLLSKQVKSLTAVKSKREFRSFLSFQTLWSFIVNSWDEGHEVLSGRREFSFLESGDGEGFVPRTSLNSSSLKRNGLKSRDRPVTTGNIKSNTSLPFSHLFNIFLLLFYIFILSFK